MRTLLHNIFFGKRSSQNLLIPSLDGLRGIAVLLVLVSHLDSYGVLPKGFEGSGKYGVYLFFTLSAFLLTYQFLRVKNVSASLLFLYFKRRIFRIYPLFTIFLLIAFFIPKTFIDYRITPTFILDHLLLKDGQSILWAIPVEFTYYVLLPILVLTFTYVFRKRLFQYSIAIVLAVLVANASYMPQKISNDISLVPYLPIFLFGSLAAYIYQLPITNALAKRFEIRLCMEIISIIAAFLIIGTVPGIYVALFHREIASDYFHKQYVYYGAVWALFLITQLLGVGIVRSILSMKLLRFIGVISFSLYVWHTIVIQEVLFSLQPYVMYLKFSVIIFVLFALATFSYLLFEYPFQKMKE